MKEIILGNYDPSIYDEKLYPDLKYFTLSKINNYDPNKSTNKKR